MRPCRTCPEASPGIHGYGPNGVKIGLILPRLFEFSETVFA